MFLEKLISCEEQQDYVAALKLQNAEVLYIQKKTKNTTEIRTCLLFLLGAQPRVVEPYCY